MEQQQKSCVLIPDAADIDRLSELHKAMGDFTRMKILWEKCILRFMRRTYQVDFRRNLRPYL